MDKIKGQKPGQSKYVEYLKSVITERVINGCKT